MSGSPDSPFHELEDIDALQARVTELERMEKERSIQLHCVRRQQAAIVTLSTHESMAVGDFEHLAEVITENVCEAMDVERVSVWLLSEDRRKLNCVDLYERTSGIHTRDMVINANRCPRYFEALEMGRTIDAGDACTDSRTSEFRDEYLEPLGISSMLDATIRVAGKVIGVVCHEHVGEPRIWRPDEISFAGAVADQAAQAYVNGRHRQAVAALQLSEERLARTEKISLVMATHVGLDGRWLKVPPTLCDLLGYAEEELLSGNFKDITHPEDFEKDWSQCQRLILGEIKSFELEKRYIRKDGDIVWVYLNCSIVSDEEGRPVHFLTYIKDISDRKRAEEARRAIEAQMQHAQKLESLGVLAGGIAHDFNNFLVGIIGNARLALDELPRQSPVRDLIARMDQAAQRAADLTNQLLAYSGKGKFVVRPIHLSHLVKEMAHLLEASISKKAALRYECAENIPFVEGDATQLRQIVMNLITNASDAIGDSAGAIGIRCGILDADGELLSGYQMGEELSEGRYVFLEVSDSGCGMAVEDLARMFEPFFTTKFTGRGLGLAAVLGIVRGHHAAIRVDSEPGRGTTVRVLFPASERTDAAESNAGRRAATAGTGETVLVVDDEEMVRSVARLTLEKAGFTVLAAADGREALEVFERHRETIGAVLLDMTMPHLSGEEVFREMRRMRADVRVVLSSGYNEQEATSHFSGSGLAGFIQKPYLPGDLVDKIAGVLKG